MVINFKLGLQLRPRGDLLVQPVPKNGSLLLFPEIHYFPLTSLLEVEKKNCQEGSLKTEPIVICLTTNIKSLKFSGVDSPKPIVIRATPVWEMDSNIGITINSSSDTNLLEDHDKCSDITLFPYSIYLVYNPKIGLDCVFVYNKAKNPTKFQLLSEEEMEVLTPLCGVNGLKLNFEQEKDSTTKRIQSFELEGSNTFKIKNSAY